MKERWGIGYVFSNGEVVYATGNEADTEGAVARFFMRAENGMPTLDRNSKMYVEVLGDGKGAKEAIEILGNINGNEIKTIAKGLEKLLDRHDAFVKTDNIEFSSKIPEGKYFLNENGKRVSPNENWVATYKSTGKTVLIELNPSIGIGKKKRDYGFGRVSSCIYGLNHININRLKKVASELKKYSK